MKKYEKVIHLIADLGNGGAERQLIELLKLNPRHKLLILKNAGIYKEDLDKLQISYTELNIKNSIGVLLSLRKICKAIKNSNSFIIHTWMYNVCFLASLLKIFYNVKLKLVWGIRCSNMELIYYSWKLRLIIYLSKIFSFTANSIVYNSYAGLNYHLSLGFSKKLNKVIHNGIDEKKFYYSIEKRNKLRKLLGISSDSVVMIFASRVDPMKNHNNLLTAFEKIREKNKKAFLLLVGKDTEKLKKQEGIFLLGMKLNIDEYYSACDIIVVPSRFGEGFSNVLAEGMLCKLLPVATNVGDAKKIISDTGFISKNYSSQEIAKSLEEALNLNKKDTSIKKERARKRILKKYSIKKMSLLYNNIYKELL